MLGPALVEKWGLIDDGKNIKNRMKDALIVFRVARDDGKPALLPGCGDAVFIGSIGAAYNTETLDEIGITHVVCAANKAQLNPKKTSLRVSIDDHPRADIEPYFRLVKAFIDGARSRSGKILVHCFQGISRAATLCVAYLLMSGECRTVDEALQSVRSCRPAAAPNPGFMSALRRLQAQVQA